MLCCYNVTVVVVVVIVVAVVVVVVFIDVDPTTLKSRRVPMLKAPKLSASDFNVLLYGRRAGGRRLLH